MGGVSKCIQQCLMSSKNIMHVRVLDYRKIVPLLLMWSDMMVHFVGCERVVSFFN
jgi:hypothetical protein